ncbi:MAG: prolyl oligopeptidase family serine peptidase [Lysobacter sp.]
MNSRSLSCGLISFMSVLLPAAAAEAPPARTVDTVDRAFGLTLPDPYRWMEGEGNSEFQTWLRHQGEATRARLDALPTTTSWRERLHAVSAGSVVNRTQRAVGDRIFFLRQKQGGEGVLMVREKDGSERTLFDPNAGKDGASITEYSASADAKRIAINIDHGGSEITQIKVFDVDDGKPLVDTIDTVWGEFRAHWLPDGSGFTYTQMAPESERVGKDLIQNMRARFHRLGTPASADPVLQKAGSEQSAPMETQYFPVVLLDADSDWALLGISGARAEMRACVAPRKLATSAAPPWRCVVDFDDKVQDVVLRGSTLYLLSSKDASNGRVLALDLNKPDARAADARVLVPEAQDAVINSVGSNGLVGARDALYLRRMKQGVDDIVRVAYSDADKTQAAPQALTMPFSGSSPWIDGDPASDGLVFVLQGWTRPRMAYRYRPGDAAPVDLKLGASTPGDYSGIDTVLTEATSADGTKVPLSIVYRKDLKRDGHALAMIVGYGAYGFSMQPAFDPLKLEWVKAGNVYAIAHVRGGGEKGAAWHAGGKGPLKYRSVEDFVASAQQLSKMGFTTPQRTAAWSASAGGMLLGGAIAKAPEQFGAAVINAGLIDTVRLLEGKNGANQVAELGDPRTAEGLKQLAAMDAYQQLRDGKRYPPTMLTVGLNDQRVVPWHSGKFGARLAAAGGGKSPVWFRTDAGSGHFATSMDEGALLWADIYAFFEAQLRSGDSAEISSR